MLEVIREDARLSHQLRYPGREPTPWRILRIALFSRGMLIINGHRTLRSLSRRAEASQSAVVRRVLRSTAAFLDYWLQIATKSDVRVGTELAPGVYLSDEGNVILGARWVGRGTVIHNRTTIGWSLKGEGTPHIGERVWIGPDCVVVGNITIGDGATILPGTVLTRNVPPNAVVEGNPARIVRRDFDNSELRRSLAAQPRLPGPAPGANSAV